MEKHKRKHSKFEINLKKVMEERDLFYKGLEEIEELKKSIDQLKQKNEQNDEILKAEMNKPEVLSALRICGDKHPGREVFFPAHRCQTYNLRKIERMRLPNGCEYNYIRILLENQLITRDSFPKEALFNFFLLMTVDQNKNVAESCFRILNNNVTNFVPHFRHLIKIFLNWGATCESLNINDGEKFFMFGNEIRLKSPDPSKTFHNLNYSLMFDYVGEICRQHPTCYEKTEKAILLKCLFRMSLDPISKDIMSSLSNCVGRVVESFQQWDSFTVTNLSRLIHDDKEHFHNQVYIIMNALPKISRCNDLFSCISYTVFHSLVQSKSRYEFPYEDEKIVEVVKMIEINPDDSHDLYKLYVFLHLLNYAVYLRNIPHKKTIMQPITDKLDELKWMVSRSILTFDGGLVKGRIMYCCSRWSLLGPGEEKVSTENFYQ